MYITQKDIDNYDLTFINSDDSIRYIKDLLSALVITQEYIENEYIKMWDDTNANKKINEDFINLIKLLDGLNLYDYFVKSCRFENIGPINSLILNNMKYLDEHSGFSMSWTFINTWSFLILGYDNFKAKWLNSV